MSNRIAYIIIAQTGDRATAHFYRKGNATFHASGSVEQILSYRAAKACPVIRYDMSGEVPLHGPRGVLSLPECEEVNPVATGETRTILERIDNYWTVPTVKDYIAEVKRRGYTVQNLEAFRAERAGK